MELVLSKNSLLILFPYHLQIRFTFTQVQKLNSDRKIAVNAWQEGIYYTSSNIINDFKVGYDLSPRDY